MNKLSKKQKNPKWHWSKQPNAGEVIKRITESREKNLEYKEKIRVRMNGKNNPMRNAETRDKMIASKLVSPYVPRGEKHHNWKGGVTPAHNRLRGSLQYVIWRNEVYKRDGWTCRICNIKCQKGNIVAHHLKKFANFPELRFILDNGITLCRKCHMETEHPSHT